MTTSVVEISFLGGSPRRKFRRVNARAPFRWLRQGVDDVRRTPVLSLLYGAVVSALMYGAVSQFEVARESIAGSMSALVVVGTFLAAGLYAASRELEQGRLPSLASSVQPLVMRWSFLGLYSLALGIVVVGCFQLSGLLFVVYLSTHSIPFDSLSSLFSGTTSGFVLGLTLGLALLSAWVIFIVSAVALPLVFDGDTDLVTSIISSYQVVSLNLGPMLVWFGIMVTLTAVGLVTWFIGLTLVFPIIGYGTWRSYRDLVSPPLSTP